MPMASALPAGVETRAIASGVWILLALAWFATLGFRPFVEPDEARYAEIPREMAQSGDWVTPRLNGLKYFEKPPLQYWATAAVFSVFGFDEWTARMWPAITGLLCIVFTAFAARRLAPGPGWVFVPLAFAGSWGFFVGGQFLTLDMGLTFFLTAAMLSFILSRAGPPDQERRWML